MWYIKCFIQGMGYIKSTYSYFKKEDAEYVAKMLEEKGILSQCKLVHE